MNTQKEFDIVYGASGGQPFVDTRLYIALKGQSELYLGSSWSLPGQELDRVGFFAGKLPAERQAALSTHLDRLKGLTQPAESPALSPDATTRYLTVTLDGQQTELTLAGETEDPILAGLEQTLLKVMADLIARPVRVAQVTMAASAEGTNLKPEVTITNIGTEVLPIILFDPGVAGQLLGITLTLEEAVVLSPDLTAWQPHMTVTTPPDYILSLFEAGTLPQGVQQLAAGKAYNFSLPPVARPSANVALHLSGTFTFHLPGSGLERRLVHVQTARQPVQ